MKNKKILFFIFILFPSCKSSLDLLVKSTTSNPPPECSKNEETQCISTAAWVASLPFSSSPFSASPGQLVFTPTLGYSNGVSTMVEFSDPQLMASSIMNGISIFGVAGTVIPHTAPDCTFSGQTGCVSVSSFVAATPPVSSNTTGSNGSLSVVPVIGKYNGTQTVTLQDSQLISNNITQGVTLFGVTGNQISSSFPFYSNAGHNSTSSPLTLYQETSMYAGSDLPSGYRDVPDVTVDDASLAPAFTWTQHTSLVNCGTDSSLSTIASRVADCLSRNPSTATWNGPTKSFQGEGIWKLVAKKTPFGTCTTTAGSCELKEVWQDQRTGLLWSSLVAGSGNTGLSSSPPFTMPTPLPSNPTYPLSYWCSVAGNNQNAGYNCSANTMSYCAEVLSPALPSENWVANIPGNYTYDDAKGGLGRYSTPGVRWRLPTLSDYALAIANGLVKVFYNYSKTNTHEWTATTMEGQKNRVLTISSSIGEILYNDKQYSMSARCVGR